MIFFFFNDTATTEIYTLSLHDALPISTALVYSYDGETRDLDDYAARRDITGLIVVRDEKVIIERYWRGADVDDHHTSWSVAKSFVATLVGIALKEGAIEDLTDPVVKYAPIYRDTDYGQTTIQHLLMMSSGIDFSENYEETGSDIRDLFFNTFFLNQDLDKVVRGYDRNRDPGQDFDYVSTNTAVLGAALSGAYGGRSLSDLAAEKVFAPLGMQAGTWLTDRNSRSGKELAYCCLNIRLEDYAKFGLLYLNQGMAGETRILPEGWANFVSTVPNEATHSPGATDPSRPVGYGHHFWIPKEQDGSFFAAGYNGQFVFINPNTNTVVAITGADQTYPGQQEVWALLRAASEVGAPVNADASDNADRMTNGPLKDGEAN